MRQLSTEDILILGLHDAVLAEFNIDFLKKQISIKIRLSDMSFLIVQLSEIKSFSGIGFDNKNKIIILDYQIDEHEIKIFTTLSEWILISFEEMLFFIYDKLM